ncbi:hypothetical protein ACJMK2_042131 [Sinanodonta woodiana]|uniref:Uncharacterized protein n=1 Tax=Sinanodonta woodiana TaxID=1069815 RepID=A0ABD3W6D2_SINWO
MLPVIIKPCKIQSKGFKSKSRERKVSVDPRAMLTLEKLSAGQATPPPQRPSSPESRTSGKHKGSVMSVTHGTNWLGGGRDLYWESLQKRPNSSHIPGWKEGLPDNMKRPRSAVAARTLNRQSRTPTPVTPSSLHYDAVVHVSPLMPHLLISVTQNATLSFIIYNSTFIHIYLL